MLYHIGAQVVAHRVGVPVGRIQQPLHPLRPRLAQVFSQLPAVLTLDRAEQPFQIPARPPSHLWPPKAGGNPPMQRRQFSRTQLSHRLQLGLGLLLARCSLPHDSLLSERVYRIPPKTVAVVLEPVMNLSRAR